MQQITRGDYLKDLITIYIENNLQTDLDDLYNQFIFQCGEIQKVLTPAQVIKISFSEQESQLLNNYNTCYLAGITKDGHKETFNGSLTFNTRGEVVYYEPPVSTVIPAATETNCDCQGLRGVFYNCSQPAVKAYFSLNYVPTKLSELTNDTDYQDSVDVAESISIHNASTDAHPYIQDLVATEASLRASQTNALGIRIGTEESVRASQTEALHQSILAEATAREEAISLAISTTEGYADTQISNHNSSEQAHPYIQSALVSATEAINVTIGDLDNLDTIDKSSVVNAINSEVTARENADNNLQTQIDGLAAASDVTDIVGTYQDLQNYDTQHLNDNDIIKVLSDSTHDNQPSYYRFDKDTDTFSYIGSESAAYTKAQSDSIFVTQTTEINGHALSSDINLTASDVGALSDTTTINDLTNTAQQNALNSGVTSSVVSQVSTNTSAIASNTSVIAQHTTAIASNTSDISTINGKIPTDASSSNKLVSASTLAASIADFANQDLSNLTSNGEARLHALKSYADEGELLTDPDGLAFVEKYAHSTFDKSKFTVVGSPLITNDGITSGFGNSNYITAATIDLSNAKSWSVSGKFTTATSNTNDQDVTTLMVVGEQYFVGCQLIWGGESGNRLRPYFNDGNGEILSSTNGYANYEPNTTVYYEMGYNNGTYYVKTGLTENSLTTIASNTNARKFGNVVIRVGICRTTVGENYYRPWGGSVDLKYFSIKVDGVEVFSGNKTGIDTIKPDDYTVVGTPTISADGVASGFSSSNYLRIPIGLPVSGKPFTIQMVANANSFVNNSFLFCTNISLSVSPKLWLYCPANGLPVLIANVGNGDRTISGVGQALSRNTNYLFEFGQRADYQFFLKVTNLDTGTIVGKEKVTTGETAFYSGNFGVALLSKADNFYWTGSIDLNAFKIYVDGNLVYQPCLKIPYTKSKTGCKIVDAIYRDRVNDMASLFGYAPYYTLSDTDFTLPQVELYGNIQQTLRNSTINGVNKNYLYSNRMQIQTGSCTSGVEVTLPTPFSDSNYALTVPYSAKSATAFTPTATGDWIAIGLGNL